MSIRVRLAPKAKTFKFVYKKKLGGGRTKGENFLFSTEFERERLESKAMLCLDDKIDRIVYIDGI